MAHKAFYVTRTEDPATHTAGAATLNRADKPQLVKVYDTAADVESDIANIGTDEVVGTKESDFEAVSIVDRVAKDNLNPVTSGAVATALSYSTDETLTGGYWIDGKPIYTRTYTGLSFGATTGTWVNVGLTVSDISALVNVHVLRTSSSGSDVIHYMNIRVQPTGVLQYYTDSRLDPAANILVLEYTKTE